MILEELIQTFAAHEKTEAEYHEKTVESFKKNYPNETMPEDMKEPFMLPKALGLICREILKLKNK